MYDLFSDMADPLNLEGIEGLSRDRSDICTIEASCVTGFEEVTVEEVKQLLECEAVAQRGRVVFDIQVSRVSEVSRLRCVNTVWVMIGHLEDAGYPDTEEGQMNTLRDIVNNHLDWEKGLRVWQRYTGCENKIYTSPGDAAEEKVSFRCTCYRTGGSHKFKSTEVQAGVGGAVHDKFHWNVKCKNYDLEFVINCDLVQVYCCLTLTNVSLYHRTVSQFGPCTLRPTICAGLVMLGRPQPGDVVLDPLCGGGTISLEGCQMGPHYHLGAEIHDLAIGRCRENYKELVTRNRLSARPAADFIQWDCLLPCLRDNSVDIIVTDLPFGKRSGSKADNRVLYPRTLLSLARVVRPGTGRAVLLTQDKNSMLKSLNKIERYWKSTKFISTNIGGLTALVFLLSRTNNSPCDK